MFRLFRYALSPPAAESSKGMLTSGAPASAHQARAQNVIYSGDKNKNKSLIPWFAQSCCLLIEIGAKHDQPTDWVGPTQ